MAAYDAQGDTVNHKVLLETTENVFSNEIQVVKDMLKYNRELFSRDILDKALLSCCRNGVHIMMPDIITAGANIEVTDDKGNTPLLLCALNRHESCAKSLIEAGANVNAVNFDGDTSLIASVLNGASYGVTRLLIGCQNIKINHANNKGHTALLCALKAANLNAIKMLIDANGIYNDIDDIDRSMVDVTYMKGLLSLVHLFKLERITGKSPLLQAALNRDIYSAQILISMDNSILNTTNDSYSNIMIQFLKSINNNVMNQAEVRMFEFLLTHVTANSPSSSEKGMIMDCAIHIGDREIVERLSMLDFVISYQNLSSAVSKPDYLRFLLTKNHIINKLDHINQPVYEESPLQKAVVEVEIESAKLLTQHGAFMDIDMALTEAIKRKQEKSLQFIIAEFSDVVKEKLKSPKLLHDAVKNSNLSIIQVLLDHGADINAKYNGERCLTQAVGIKVLETLLSRGADPNVKNRNGRTALHLAASRTNSVATLELLIKYGANVNITNKKGESPLMIAVIYEQIKNTQCLVDAGADINCLYKSTGKTVLFDAENRAILKILLDKGVDVKTIDGDSPLNCLLAKRNIGQEHVKRLIDAGCDVNHENKDGSTALILATKHMDVSLLQLLIENGADINAPEGKVPFRTPLTSLFSKLWAFGEKATSCVHYLMDKNASLDNVKSTVIHIFITSGCLSLIPSFISSGLAPANLLKEKSPEPWFRPAITITRISPLMMALLLNQTDLAQYFINMKYLLESDIDVLYGHVNFQMLLREKSALNSLDLLSTFSRNPLALETLCFVVISDTLNSNQDRKLKVQKLGLPQPWQDRLLFKNASGTKMEDTGIKDMDLYNMSWQK